MTRLDDLPSNKVSHFPPQALQDPRQSHVLGILSTGGLRFSSRALQRAAGRHRCRSGAAPAPRGTAHTHLASSGTAAPAAAAPGEPSLRAPGQSCGERRHVSAGDPFTVLLNRNLPTPTLGNPASIPLQPAEPPSLTGLLATVACFQSHVFIYNTPNLLQFLLIFFKFYLILFFLEPQKQHVQQ